MYYTIRAVIENPNHPEYGAVTVYFPISNGEYDQTLQRLSEAEIGEADLRDCRIVEIDSSCEALENIKGTRVNVDELDYLAKRLDGFDVYEMLQFTAAVSHYGFTDMTNLINLSFCSQETTVIADFSNLEGVGKQHFLTINGSVTVEMMERMDGRKAAEDLIRSNEGHITPYGVFYDNGMKLRQVYDGVHLPPYLYEPYEALVFISPADRPEESEALYFPCLPSKISRAMRRLDTDDLRKCTVTLDYLPRFGSEVWELLTEKVDLRENLGALSCLTETAAAMDNDKMEDFQTVLFLLRPQDIEEVLTLAENFEDITLEQNICSPENLGWRLIEDSIGLDICADLDAYIDFEKYGEDRVRQENGIFTEYGYLTYKGSDPEMAKLLTRITQEQQQNLHQEMGGI